MAKEYIEREAMIQRLKNTPLFSNFNTGGISLRDGVIDLVEKQSAADVVEVRHGHWITRDVKGLEKEVQCSVCHSKDYYPPSYFPYIRYPNYCGDCGAKMDGERKEK